MGILLSLLLAFATSGQSHIADVQNPQTVRCDDGAAEIELFICRTPALLSHDQALAIINQSVGAPPALAAAQREWENERRDRCTSTNCVADAYNSRIRELLRGMESAQTFVREWEPGELIISPVDNERQGFSLLALSVNPDGLGGDYLAFGGVGRFGDDAGEWTARGCTLTFRRIPDGWRVEDNGACTSAARGTLEGDYLHSPEAADGMNLFDAVM